MRIRTRKSALLNCQLLQVDGQKRLQKWTVFADLFLYLTEKDVPNIADSPNEMEMDTFEEYEILFFSLKRTQSTYSFENKSFYYFSEMNLQTFLWRSNG